MSRITINQLPQAVKRGQVQPKDYWNDDYFRQLEPLVSALKEEAPDAKYDGKALVFMLVHLLHFQEAALGKDAMPPRPAPKLPIKLITDPSVGGALHAIALKLADIRRSRQLKAIEWQNPGKRKECMEILLVLRRELERRGLLVVPHVHISPSCGTEVQRLREYMRRLQGQLAESPDEAGVTHIVYPFGDKGDPDDGKEYTTVLAVKGTQARVHYWYMPDSYDAWIPLGDVDNKEVVPDRIPPGGVWKVTPRWIIDSERYNEWMNQADYTTPEMDAEMDAAEAADAKGGKRSGAALAGQAKKARTDGTLEVAAEPLVVLGPTARLRKVLQPHRGMLEGAHTVENLSQGQINTHLAAYLPPVPPTVQRRQQAAASAAQPQADDEQQRRAAANGPSAAAAATGGRPPPFGRSHLPYIGASAGWFRHNTVHPIERAALPEFCNSHTDKTITMYREYRDTMINMYLEHPERDLTFAEVRQHIDGEVNGLMRIYELLQAWGIINVANKAGVQPHMQLGVGPGVSARMAPGTACLYEFKAPSWLEATSAAQAGGMYGSATSAAAGGDGSRLLHPMAGRKGAEEGLNPSCLTRIFCSAMPWVDCTRLRYHCTKYPDINLCPEAFAAGCFPPGVGSKDFVRIDDSKRHNSSDGWTPEETMLLLEGVELYKEDWAKIASHVGKSQAACLTHFVRLPIEDHYIDDLTHWNDVAPRQQQQQQQQQLPPLPFQDEQNPLMSNLGVLSIILGPKVSGASAQAAMQVLAEQDVEAGAVINPEVRLAEVKAAAKRGAANGHLSGSNQTQQQQQQQQQQGEAGDGLNGVVMQDADSQQQQQQQNGELPDDNEQQQQQRRLQRQRQLEAAVNPQQQVDKPLVLSAVAAGLVAAATRAQLLAESEEREIQRLMVGLVDTAAKKVDAKMSLLQQLCDPPGLERDTVQVTATLKPLSNERMTVSAQLKQAQARDAALKQQKAEAAKKQQAEAMARHKAAAAAAAAAQKQQQADAAAKPTAASQQQQQQTTQQQQPGGLPPPALPPAAAAAAAVGAPGLGGVGGAHAVSPMGLGIQPPQPSQSQELEPTPGKSTVSSGAGDSGLLDDEDDLGELLEDVPEGDMDLDDEDLDDDMPDGDMP